MADEQKLCKDGFRPADEMQYRTACTMFGNWSCCWQRWVSGVDHKEIFACRNMTRMEAGEYIGNRAIDWIIKKYPSDEAWIRGEVESYNFGYVEPEPEPEPDPWGGGWNPMPGPVPDPTPDPTPEPTPDPTPDPTGDCSEHTSKLQNIKQELLRIAGEI